MRKIKVIHKKVGEQAVITEMEHSLENMQKMVGGTLDSVFLPQKIVMWVDDEGLLKESPINLVTYVEGYQVHHIAGDVLFTGIDDEGETISLTDEQIVAIINNFRIAGHSFNKKAEKYFVYALLVDGMNS
jgi:hypothetical protein